MGLEELKGRRVRKSEVERLLADRKWTKDARLTSFFGQGDTYVHPENDSVLAVDWNGKGGMLFSDKETVYRVVSDPDTLKSRHMLRGLFNYGEEFPVRSQALAERFIAEIALGLEEAIGAPSMEALRFVDRYVSRNGADKLLQPELFAGLLAYVGEAVAKSHSMQWRMVKVDEDLWEPWLVDAAGNRYPIFAPLYKELYEYRRGRSSLYGVVVGEVQKSRLLSR
jgi:hypothetical protein